MMKKPTKRELLEKYQTREPTLFVQIDAFKTAADGDNLMQPDGDGFWLQARHTFELMDSVDVRVLISPKADRKDVRVVLKKLMDRIDQDGLQLLDGAKEDLEKTQGIDGIVESLIRIRGFQWNDFERLFRAAREKFDDKTPKSDDECPFW
jgi:hypothetical protein